MSSPPPLGIMVEERIQTDDGMVGAPLPKGMKVMVQWARKDPQGWEETDARNWSRHPKRSVPGRGQLGAQDNSAGHIRNVNVQGITTEGYDHVAIEPITIGNDEGVKLTVWNDDPDDYSPDEYTGIVWTILPLAPDPRLGMAINTRQSCVWYCSGAKFDFRSANRTDNMSVRPWSEFVPPDERVVRHGIWLADDHLKSHIEKAPHHEFGWMHWNDHLPDSECEPHHSTGKRVLKEQRKQGRYRKSSSTITYYQRDTARAAGWTTATNENALETTTAASGTQTATINAATVEPWAFATAASQPNFATWPDGVYHFQFNCTAISAGVTCTVDTGASEGFCVLSSDLATKTNGVAGSGSAVSGTGLTLQLTAGASNVWSPSGETAASRYGHRINSTGDSHGDTITLQFNTTDSYSDGPWVTSTDPQPSVSDTVTTTDAPTVQLTSFISKIDTSTVTDTPTVNLLSFISVADSTTVSDSASAVIVCVISGVSDTVTMSDAPTMILISFINVTDTATVSEAITMLIPVLVPVAADSVTVTDTPTVNLTSFINVADATTIADAPSLMITSMLSVADTVSLAESIIMMLQSFIGVADTVTVSDSANLNLLSFIQVADTATVSENITVSISTQGDLVITVSDGITVSELITMLGPSAAGIIDGNATIGLTSRMSYAQGPTVGYGM